MWPPEIIDEILHVTSNQAGRLSVSGRFVGAGATVLIASDVKSPRNLFPAFILGRFCGQSGGKVPQPALTNLKNTLKLSSRAHHTNTASTPIPSYKQGES